MKQYDTSKIIEDYKELKSTHKVAPLHGVTATTIRSILKKNNVELPHINDKHKEHIPSALEDYKNGVSMIGVGKKYGFTPTFFKKILKENNLEYIDRAKNPFSGPVVYIKKNLKSLIGDYNTNKNLSEVAVKHNIKFEPLYRYFKNHNLLSREHDHIDKEKSQLLKDEVYKMYEGGLGQAAIGKILNTSRYNIKKIILEHFGKEFMRSKSEAIRLNNLTEEHQRKAHAGLGKKRNYTLPSGNIIPIQGYEDHFLNYVFKYSNLKEEDFQFTPRKRIKLSDSPKTKHKHYYPDFFIPKYNLIIEIKSWYTFNMNVYLNKRKIRKTREEGYKFIMIKDKKYNIFHKYLKENNLLK